MKNQKNNTLAKMIPLWVLWTISSATAQIPVTDAATNGSLGMVNSQLLQTNIQLKAVNRNLLRLISLMEKNNQETSKSKAILKEELDAKKSAPAYVLQSPDVGTTITLKAKILKAYQSSKATIEGFNYLEDSEVQDFLRFAADVLFRTKTLFAQCKAILKTKSIILPEERLKKITTINIELEQLLDELIAYNLRMAQLNSFREAKGTLINLNKN